MEARKADARPLIASLRRWCTAHQRNRPPMKVIVNGPGSRWRKRWRFGSCDLQERSPNGSNASQPRRQESARCGSGGGGCEGAVRGRCRVPRTHRHADDRSACQGTCWSGVYMRVVKNTLASQGRAGTDVRVRWAPTLKGPARAGFLEGRSRRCRAPDQGLREGERQAVATLVVHRWLRAAGEGPRRWQSLPTREQAPRMLLGVLKAPIEKFVRTVPRRNQAGPHARRPGGEAGERLMFDP
jgi:hypothetical protein